MKRKITSFIASLFSLSLMLSGSYAYAAESESEYTGESVEFVLDDAENFELSMPEYPMLLSNFTSDSYTYGEFLEGNNLTVYNAIMRAWTDPTDKVLSVPLNTKIEVQLSALPNSSFYSTEDAAALSQAVFSNCKAGIDSLAFDMPELYWLDTNHIKINFANVSYTYSKSKGYTFKIGTLTFTPGLVDGFLSAKDALGHKEEFFNAVENFPVEGKTRYEQIKSIHDRIAKFTYYDTNGKYASSAMGALVEPGVVCEGYSEAFKLICDRLGIPCIVVFGNFKETDRTAHMWNYVKMEDDKWYAVDVTWDDLDGGEGKELKYEYFMKGSASFFKNHTEENNYAGTVFTYPKISEADYVFKDSSEIINGDYNGDGKFSVADMVICQNNLIGKSEDIFCDYNEDGSFDSFDLALMRMNLISVEY